MCYRQPALTNVYKKGSKLHRIARSVRVGLATESDPSLFVFVVEEYNLRCKTDGLSRATMTEGSAGAAGTVVTLVNEYSLKGSEDAHQLIIS